MRKLRYAFVTLLVFGLVLSTAYAAFYTKFEGEDRRGMPTEDMALVYVFRPTFRGGAVRTWTFADEQVIGVSRMRGYYFALVPEGKHVFWSGNSGTISVLELEVAGGETYYLKAGLQERASLEQVSEDQAGVYFETCVYVELTEDGRLRAAYLAENWLALARKKADKKKRRNLRIAAREAQSTGGVPAPRLGSEASAKPAKGDLFSAIEDGDYDQAAQLISGDANLEAKDEDGNSPLHIAADRGRGRIAKLLVDKGADVNARNSEGITPLHEAAAMGDFQTASLLVEAGADVKAKSDFGATPLHFAAEMRNFEIAQIIRSMGMSSTYNWKEDNLEVAELLIRNGGDPNAQDNIGSTPLQRTTPWNYLPMAKLLIESGADPMLPDGNGLTPLDHAKDKGARDVAKYLKKVQKSKK